MTHYIALIDANNFYATCEQSIDPTISNYPVVVLSNNDGCIISRSTKARELGFLMGEPYFKARQRLKRLNVIVRSSNYELYGDISKRLMQLLQENCIQLEIYSIDEAFAKIKILSNKKLHYWASSLRELVYQNLGITISIGVGKNKSQAKIANYLAKNRYSKAGIFNLDAIKNQGEWLENIGIEKVWGIGKKLAPWYRSKGVINIRQLRDMPSHEILARHGVNGIRLQKEFQGFQCFPLLTNRKSNQTLCVSRSFSHPISELEELLHAISLYAIRASEKLRQQNQTTARISVFIRTSRFKKPFYSKKETIKLNIPSNNTFTILSISLALTKKLFEPCLSLTKAGVIMHKLQKRNHIQHSLLDQINTKEVEKGERLMKVIDNINMLYGKDSIKWAICLSEKRWEPRRQKLSPAFTTRVMKVPIVHA